MQGQEPIWTPSPARIARAGMTDFTRFAGSRQGKSFKNYAELHRWSIDHGDAFWSLLWDFCGVIGDKGERVLVDGDSMLGARFFPDASLNFAENLLRKSGSSNAIVFRSEDKAERRVSWDDLRGMVARLASALLALGVGPGDRVAAMLPNMPETVAAMLAVASIGAVWASCSPDFGEESVVDRFGQIEPKVILCADGYWYAGKRIDLAGKIEAIETRLPGLLATVVVELIGTAKAIADAVDRRLTFSAMIDGQPPQPLRFARLPFSHPLVIMFSSGTTGKPKCILHSTGGVLLQHLKEHRLHSDIRDGDRVFYYSTCGWMMWNWLVSSLATGATLLLYDGSPSAPSLDVLFRYAADEHASFFGTSAKFIDLLRTTEARPGEAFDLASLRTVASTGSPLGPDGFRYIYEHVKADVHLASISGGTDILSCFVLGVPTEPVYAGEIQAAGLGMAVDVWNDAGRPARQEKGELVCAKSFPSMPLGFWNDPDGRRYRAAYFDRFENVWHHGDFAEWTAKDGLIIHGRSDATLNPGGVRIGTAEIYNQVDRVAEIAEALCIGQNWKDDVRIVLFVRTKPGQVLDAALEDRIRRVIRSGATPRHVPARIVAVDDFPRTLSGKISELAVRDAVHGLAIKNAEALANPAILEAFTDIADLSH